MSTPDNITPVMAQRLLQAMAEQLKLPLLQIARQAEQAQAGSEQRLLEGIEVAATQALWFVDSYLLSQELLKQTTLELEPVTVSAVLDQAAHELSALAKQYDCKLELRLSGRYGPVMAHRQALQAALTGLGSAMIMANANNPGNLPLVLAGHKSRSGVVAGIFSQTEGLSQAVYNKGKSLYGKARQPIQDFSVQSGTAVFVADSLLASMQAQLRVAKHHKLTGLAATLQPSLQLALV